VCRSKHVEQLINIGITNYSTRLHLVGYFYMNIGKCMHYLFLIFNNTLLFEQGVFRYFI
jgi:hypothetical protein